MLGKTQHTPIPWVMHYCGDNKLEIHPAGDEDGLEIIADINPENDYPEKEAEANGEFICKAVNNYADLVKALDDLVEDCEGREIPETAEDGYEAYHQAKAVLAKIFDPQPAGEG